MLISLFITCYNDTLFPETGKAVVTVLERLGHQVEFREAQTCCGQMHFNTGYAAQALPLMRRTIEVFRGSGPICVPSASCVSMMRDHYPKLAAEAQDPALPAELEAFLSRVYEFSELLVDELQVTDVGATFPYKVTLHTSCHSLRSLHLADQPVRLLKAVRGLEFVALPRHDECCGFGGTFAVKNADVSTAMGLEKVRSVQDTGAAVCAAGDNSCLMQIGGLLHRQGAAVRCLHLAEILAATHAGDSLPPEGGSHPSSMGVASGHPSTGVASGHPSTGMASGQPSTGVACGQPSTGVASGHSSSMDVASGQPSTGVASGHSSRGVASGFGRKAGPGAENAAS